MALDVAEWAERKEKHNHAFAIYNVQTSFKVVPKSKMKSRSFNRTVP